MFNHDFDEFNELIGDLASLYSKTLTPKQTAMYFRVLSNYPLEAIQSAMDAHSRDAERGRFMPLPADLIAQLEAMRFDGRPRAEEAWATAIGSLDESETITWTEETSEAWYSCANELMRAGDKFNASRGFIAKYDELVLLARKQNKPVKWIVTQGQDKDKRDQSIRESYKAKKISQSQAVILLPHHKNDGESYEAIKSTVSLMIENKCATTGHHELERVAAIKKAGEAQQQRIAEHKKAAQASDIDRVDGTKSKRDTLAIFEDAERLGVFSSDKERKEWCAKAANGESMKDLQVMMLAKRQELKTRGAA